jgi:hypothetical protein
LVRDHSFGGWEEGQKEWQRVSGFKNDDVLWTDKIGNTGRTGPMPMSYRNLDEEKIKRIIKEYKLIKKDRL